MSTMAAESSAQWVRVQRRAMACSFEITLDHADARWVPAAQAALKDVADIESRLTVFRETSDIADLNRRACDAAVVCDPELFALLKRCDELSRGTAGAFDITSTPLMRCWGFLRREGRVPPDADVEAARAIVGHHHIEFDSDQRQIRFAKRGIEISLGAIGKGYALDRAAQRLRRQGVTRALLSAGRSSLLGVGGKGRGWPVDVVSPRRARPLARVWLRDAAIGTSGAGEQFVMADGRRLGHVLDPRSGRPAEGWLSASVITPSAADADALSTAFLVGGPALALDYCERHANVMALLTPDDGTDTTLVIGRCDAAEVEDP